MKFAHLSDIHFTIHPQDYPMIRSNLHDALSLLVDDLSRIEKHIDFISITGDLTQVGDLDSCRGLKTLLDRLTIPVYVVPGNHDLRGPFRDVFGASNIETSDAALDYAYSFGKVQVLGFDTMIEGEVSGRISETQLARLQINLNSEAFSHTVVSMHHPPFPTKHSDFDAMGLMEGVDELGAMIGSAKSKVILLCGHVHRPYQAVWNGANCYISGGPPFQIGSSFCFGDSELDVVDEPYAYFIHSIDQRGDHVVGTRYVELSGGPSSSGNQRGASR